MSIKMILKNDNDDEYVDEMNTVVHDKDEYIDIDDEEKDDE